MRRTEEIAFKEFLERYSREETCRAELFRLHLSFQHALSCGAEYKYFAWLEEREVTSVSDAGVVHIQKFLLSWSECYAPSTIHNLWIYLKKLYSFLYETGRTEGNYI